MARAGGLMRATVLFVLGMAFAGAAPAQERFSLFVPTVHEDVTRMIKLAGVRDGDVVFDLGSGDGRIVLEAARANPKVRGRGVEIDLKLVEDSRKVAEKGGLAERVQFLHENAFDADLKEATVIAMWLWPELMRMLRPRILAEARPGTRVITRTWDLGEWKPDETSIEGTPIFKWIVPAKVEGNWDWSVAFPKGPRNYAAVFEQRFQMIEGVVRTGNRRNVFENMKLTGDEISFRLLMTLDELGLTRHDFKGRVRGDVIEGTVEIFLDIHQPTLTLPWRAKRVASSAYFARNTGTDLR